MHRVYLGALFELNWGVYTPMGVLFPCPNSVCTHSCLHSALFTPISVYIQLCLHPSFYTSSVYIQLCNHLCLCSVCLQSFLFTSSCVYTHPFTLALFAPSFVYTHLFTPASVCTYLCLHVPLFTPICWHLSLLTPICLHLPLFTPISLYTQLCLHPALCNPQRPKHLSSKEKVINLVEAFSSPSTTAVITAEEARVCSLYFPLKGLVASVSLLIYVFFLVDLCWPAGSLKIKKC